MKIYLLSAILLVVVTACHYDPDAYSDSMMSEYYIEELDEYYWPNIMDTIEQNNGYINLRKTDSYKEIKRTYNFYKKYSISPHYKNDESLMEVFHNAEHKMYTMQVLQISLDKRK
jgi:hypothetical protein